MTTSPTTFPLSYLATHLQRSAIRDMIALANQPEVISFAGGLPAADHLPVAEL